MTEKESLELISRMIQNTRARMAEGSGVSFLIWGYTTVVVSMLVWGLLIATGNPQWQWLWLLLPLSGSLLSIIYYKRHSRKPHAVTYVDRVVGYIWLVLGVTGFVLSMFSIVIKLPTLFAILLIMGAGTTLTGLVIRFKPLVVSGVVGIICSFPILLLAWKIQIPLFAVAFLVMMVIPGHILNNAARKSSK